MTIIEKAKWLRRIIESLAATLSDEEALSAVDLFPSWEAGADYTIDDRVRYQNILYRCLIAHTSQSDWTPNDAISLWTRVLIPEPDVIPEWVQPESTNPYMKGDKVRHNSKIWISDFDYNVFEPGVAGWTEVI